MIELLQQRVRLMIELLQQRVVLMIELLRQRVELLGDECGSTHPRNSAHRAWPFRVANAWANHGRKLSSLLSIQA